jgi:hypothetical protein
VGDVFASLPDKTTITAANDGNYSEEQTCDFEPAASSEYTGASASASASASAFAPALVPDSMTGSAESREGIKLKSNKEATSSMLSSNNKPTEAQKFHHHQQRNRQRNGCSIAQQHADAVQFLYSLCASDSTIILRCGLTGGSCPYKVPPPSIRNHSLILEKPTASTCISSYTSLSTSSPSTTSLLVAQKKRRWLPPRIYSSKKEAEEPLLYEERVKTAAAYAAAAAARSGATTSFHHYFGVRDDTTVPVLSRKYDAYRQSSVVRFIADVTQVGLRSELSTRLVTVNTIYPSLSAQEKKRKSSLKTTSAVTGSGTGSGTKTGSGIGVNTSIRTYRPDDREESLPSYMKAPPLEFRYPAYPEEQLRADCLLAMHSFNQAIESRRKFQAFLDNILPNLQPEATFITVMLSGDELLSYLRQTGKSSLEFNVTPDISDVDVDADFDVDVDCAATEGRKAGGTVKRLSLPPPINLDSYPYPEDVRASIEEYHLQIKRFSLHHFTIGSTATAEDDRKGNLISVGSDNCDNNNNAIVSRSHNTATDELSYAADSSNDAPPFHSRQRIIEEDNWLGPHQVCTKLWYKDPMDKCTTKLPPTTSSTAASSSCSSSVNQWSADAGVNAIDSTNTTEEVEAMTEVLVTGLTDPLNPLHCAFRSEGFELQRVFPLSHLKHFTFGIQHVSLLPSASSTTTTKVAGKAEADAEAEAEKALYGCYKCVIWHRPASFVMPATTPTPTAARSTVAACPRPQGKAPNYRTCVALYLSHRVLILRCKMIILSSHCFVNRVLCDNCVM